MSVELSAHAADSRTPDAAAPPAGPSSAVAETLCRSAAVCASVADPVCPRVVLAAVAVGAHEFVEGRSCRSHRVRLQVL